MAGENDHWLKLYLEALDHKLDAHMLADQMEHRAMREEITGMRKTFWRWALIASLGAGGTAAGTRAVAESVSQTKQPPKVSATSTHSSTTVYQRPTED